MHTIKTWMATAVVCVVLLSTSAFAQYDNGSIVGTVRDNAGSVIPGATVTVTNPATGMASTIITNASGDYQVPELRVGQYNIEVSKTGFASAKATDITVSVGGRQRIDLSMPIGNTSTTVQVSGVSLQIQTETSQREQVVTRYQSEALPLVTRNYSDLLGLVTGVRQAPRRLRPAPSAVLHVPALTT